MAPKLSFGRYAGRPVEEVPTDYLRWVRRYGGASVARSADKGVAGAELKRRRKAARERLLEIRAKLRARERRGDGPGRAR